MSNAAPSAVVSPSVESLVLSLHSIHAICLDGPYTLKSGVKSPFYIDLRLIIGHTDVLRAVSEAMWATVAECQFDRICGVPYTALPIATLMADKHNKPMIMRRKEGSKSYGLKKSIEGEWKPGEKVLIVEDLITSGLSVFETIEPIKACGLEVTDIVVLINREQGGRQNIESRGLNLHAVVTISQVMDILERHGRISKQIVQQVQQFIQDSQVEIKSPEAVMSPTPDTRLTYADRISLCANSAARALLTIMNDKQTNLCLSADVTTKQQLLDLAERAGPYICMLKTHVDILLDWDPTVSASLEALARKHNYLLFEDRKFADIGSTVESQYKGGVYRIADWSHVVNAHVIAGPGIIKGLQRAVQSRLTESNSDPSAPPRGLLLIAEMSSEGALATGSYTDANVQMAEANPEFVFGFICQHALSRQPGMIHLSPGVQLPLSSAETCSTASSTSLSSSSSSASSRRVATDNLGQQYHTPHDIICVKDSDVIIVGRAIVQSPDIAAECARYQRAGWDAYLGKIQGGR